MSRIPNRYYRRGSQTFDLVLGDEEPFRPHDYQWLNNALDDHDHGPERGRAVGRVGPDSVGTEALLDQAVLSTKLAAASILAGNLAAACILLPGIGARAIHQALERDGPIVFSRFADRSISGDKVALGTITADLIAPGTIVPLTVPDGSITTAKLQDGGVWGEDLADGAVGIEHRPAVPWACWRQKGQIRCPNTYTAEFYGVHDEFQADQGDPWSIARGGITHWCPPWPGVYRVHGHSRFGDDQDTDSASLTLRKNGAQAIAVAPTWIGSFEKPGAGHTVSIDTLVYLDGDDDYVEWIVTGGTQEWQLAVNASTFGIYWTGP